MDRRLALAVPLVLAVPPAYAVGFLAAGHGLRPTALLAGAGGWLAALVLRGPVGILAFRATGSAEGAQPWVVAASGPLEEGIRLAAVLLVGRDLTTALWLGLGWGAIEAVYAVVNGIAVARLRDRDDPEAEQARALLPPAVLSEAAPLWGVAERVWATGLHVGFTLVVAASPPAAVATAAVHTAVNVWALRLLHLVRLWVVTAAGTAVAGTVLAVGLALH